MSLGVAAAIAAAMLYNLSIVIQKTQAEQVETGGVRIIGSLWKRPVWLFGIALQLVGFGLHSFALTSAPVTVVQPIIASGIAFVVIFAALLLGERPTSREIGGMAMSMAGVSLLVMRPEPLAAMREVTPLQLGLAISCAALLIGGMLHLSASGGFQSAGLRAALIGSAAGMGDGMSDAMNRLLGTWLAPSAGWIPPASMGVAAGALLLAFGFQGFVTAQNALKLHRANTVIPCILIVQLLAPIVIAALLYGQSLPSGGTNLAIWLAAIALSVAGIATLANSSQVAELRAGAAQAD